MASVPRSVVFQLVGVRTNCVDTSDRACPECGLRQPATALFCSRCGSKLGGDAAGSHPQPQTRGWSRPELALVVGIVVAIVFGGVLLVPRLVGSPPVAGSPPPVAEQSGLLATDAPLDSAAPVQPTTESAAPGGVAVGDDELLQVESAEEWPGDENWKPAKGSVFLAVDATVTGRNKGGSYNIFYFTLKDRDGREYEPYLGSPMPAFGAGQLGAGEKARGWLAFEVPSTEGMTLVYKIIGGPSAQIPLGKVGGATSPGTTSSRPQHFETLYCRAYALWAATTGDLLDDMLVTLRKSQAGLVSDLFVRTVANSNASSLRGVIDAWKRVPSYAPAADAKAAMIKETRELKTAMNKYAKGFSLSPTAGQKYIDQAAAILGTADGDQTIAFNAHAALVAEEGLVCP